MPNGNQSMRSAPSGNVSVRAPPAAAPSVAPTKDVKFFTEEDAANLSVAEIERRVAKLHGKPPPPPPQIIASGTLPEDEEDLIAVRPESDRCAVALERSARRGDVGFE